MTIEEIEIPFDTDKFSELSKDKRLRFIEDTISDYENRLSPIFGWFADELEFNVEYGNGSLIVSIEEIHKISGGYSGDAHIMFDLMYFASCDDMCSEFERESIIRFKIFDDYLYITFTPPVNKGLSNSTHNL